MASNTVNWRYLRFLDIFFTPFASHSNSLVRENHCIVFVHCPVASDADASLCYNRLSGWAWVDESVSNGTALNAPLLA